jgi:glycosyltransferase involved in cell wall biosynthesis
LKKLVIISHTAHQIHPEYGPVGWGPTIREINFLSVYWDEVVHVACLESSEPVGSSLPYSSSNIRFVPIPPFGGQNWRDKFDIIIKAPKVLNVVHSALKGATEVQLRLPMSMGVFLMPYFKWFARRSFTLWVKYANNWIEPSKSASYRLQQRLLRSNWLDCPVTINGNWPNQPLHCKTFENPCLTKEQNIAGFELIKKKSLGPPYVFIFIGRVDAAKGVDLIMNALNILPKKNIAKFHIAGEGPLLLALTMRLEALQIPFFSHGFITQEAIFKLLAGSHFLILPSRSEGFPKVVAEAINYGCLPIISAVGSVPCYIQNGVNGFLMKNLTHESLANTILKATETNVHKLQNMMQNGRVLASKFTFNAYIKRLKQEVIDVS